ncbi:hypothetical protein MBAV_000252, partial [Candidatus Magnetobacterium bavaricum]
MYDVFFSYSGDSLDLTENVANYLDDNGVSVWFDKWDLIPGDDWRSVAKEVLYNSYSVAVD